MKEEFTTNARRWYDKDPILSSAMKTLEESDDETQIKVALNLIKIITEHNISNSEYESVEDIVSATEDIFITKNGKIIAKLTNPYQDRVETAKSLFGILPKDASLEEAKTERLGAK